MGRRAKPASDETILGPAEAAERQMLASRLRMLRVRRQLSLSTVALGTGLSRSFLALLESGASDISVSRLLRVADFYGVWLADLVGASAPTVEVVRAGDARAVPVDGTGSVRLLSLQSPRAVSPFRIELPPGSAVEGGLSHTGEEFVHCVSGTIELEIVGSNHQLVAGDTASFPGRLPHSYRNVGNTDAVLIGATARYG